MLTPEQAEQLRAQLESVRARIVDKARDAIGFAMGRTPGHVGRDSIDASVEEGMYSTELRMHDRERNLLGKVTDALRRLEDGEIDQCEDCGDNISFRRLLARPVTTLCVSCKEDREAGEAAAGSKTSGADEFLSED